jgi:hypothetical protein
MILLMHSDTLSLSVFAKLRQYPSLYPDVARIAVRDQYNETAVWNAPGNTFEDTELFIHAWHNNGELSFDCLQRRV